MQLIDLIAIRQEARSSVAEELRLDLWSLPPKKAERLEAYEARIAQHVAALSKQTLEDAVAAAVTEVAGAAEVKAVKVSKASDEATSAPDLTDDVDDGADLF